MFTQDEIEARLGLGRNRLIWQIAFLAPCSILLLILAEIPWSGSPLLFLPIVGWWLVGVGLAYRMTPGAGRASFDGPDPAEFL